MRVIIFNDTRLDWTLHSASDRGINGENHIPKNSAITFEGPEGSEVFVKVWGKAVMVRFVAPGTAETLVPLRRGSPSRSRDAERMNTEASAGLYGAVRDIRRGI